MKFDETKCQIGQRIKDIRNRQGLTQEELAEAVGINAKYLSSVERGRENPTLNILLKIAHSLNSLPYEIFDISEQTDSETNKQRIGFLVQKADPTQLKVILKILSTVLH